MRLAQLSGSHVEGLLQVSDVALNDVLAANSAGHTRPTLELRPHNDVVVRYGMLHAHATLPDAVTLGESPRLTLSLKSLLIAVALKAIVHKPFLHVHGRRLTIELAAVPGLEAWRELWRHVQQVRLETAAGALRIQFAVVVTD